MPELTDILYRGTVPMRRAPSGAWMSIIPDDQGHEGESAAAGGADEGGADKGKTFSQADVDKIAARTRAEAAKTAKTEIDAYLAAEKAKADQATLSDTDRARAEAETAKTEAAALKAEAAAERFAAKVERALTAKGVPEAALARAVRMSTLDADADDAQIAAEADEIAKLLAPTPTTGKPTSGVTGAKGPGGGQATRSALDRGKDRWRETHPDKSTSAA